MKILLVTLLALSSFSLFAQKAVPLDSVVWVIGSVITCQIARPDSNGWIDVNDSLPSTRDKYLVHIRRCDATYKTACETFIQAVFYHPKYDKETYESGWATWYMRYDEYSRYTVKVTHWQPLPPKPKDK